MKTIKLGVAIGRFQPVHRGHLEHVLRPCYEESDHMLVLLGSANRAVSPKNPFSPAERFALIRAALDGDGAELHVEELDDFSYSEVLWLQQVQERVGKYVTSLETLAHAEVEVTLYGARKDASSYYVESFPQWTRRLSDETVEEMLSATEIRRRIWEGDERWRELVPEAVVPMLSAWTETEACAWCQREHAYYKRYQEPYARFEREMRHGYIALTCDPVVFHKGRVLLVRRRLHPGKGLWALPGGYLRKDETPLAGVLRECREETKFKLSPSWCYDERTYAAPRRSLKGRVITFGFGFKVPDRVDDDPVAHAMAIRGIRAGSDAAHAQWIPVDDVLRKEQFRRGMFEDHFDIVADMYRRVPG